MWKEDIRYLFTNRRLFYIGWYFRLEFFHFGDVLLAVLASVSGLA